MSMAPELGTVLEQRIEALRGVRERLNKLVDAAIEDRTLSARLAAVMGEGWISVLVHAGGAAADRAVCMEFELRHPAGPDEPKGGGS